MKPTGTRDKLTILAAAVAVVALLAGAAALTPRINESRRTLQLTANDDIMANLPPDIAFTQAALGAFRGLIVDILWARANQMQQDGQFYEANQLAEWITKLQPRFAEVWRFHAWNMSYNISVMTHTAHERWIWVRSGINLLRDEAIPLNPNAVTLYRELGNIYLHKIGQFTDEMHEYYKKMTAREWHQILGAPPAGDTDVVLEAFRPIAELYDQYLNNSTPSQAAAEEMQRLLLKRDDLNNALDDFPVLSLNQLDIALDVLRRDRANAGDTAFAADSQPLRDLLDRQLDGLTRPGLERFVADHPDVAPLIDRIRELGHKPDLTFLRRLSEANEVRVSEHVQLLGLAEPEELAAEHVPFRQFLDDPDIAEPRDLLLAFIRAKVIGENYHMDPTWMFTLMKGEWFVKPDLLEQARAEGKVPELPIDWRHPLAHALYWASLGVRRSHGVVNFHSLDSLNTDRVALSALQSLTYFGQVVYDPLTNYYRQLPDVRFIEPFNQAIFGAFSRVQTDYDTYVDQYVRGGTAPESYMAWHEYFLTSAITTYYLYGNMAKATEYYEDLRRLYSDFMPDRRIRYQQPLEQFVFSQFVESATIKSNDDVLISVNTLLLRAFDEGFANNREDVAQRCITWARQIHASFNARNQFANTPSDEEISLKRMELPPFDEMLELALQNFMTSPESGPITLPMKSRVWSSVGVNLKRRIFDKLQKPLYDQTVRLGLDPRRIFPEPPGMEQYRQQNGGRDTPRRRLPDAGTAPVVN